MLSWSHSPSTSRQPSSWSPVVLSRVSWLPLSLPFTYLDLRQYNYSCFDELSALLEQLATYQASVYIIGDFNIQSDRPDDPHSVQFRLLVDCYIV